MAASASWLPPSPAASMPGSSLEPYFSLSKEATIFALCGYGFIASVLPVWLLLCPRDYISSFLKVGTITLLIVGVIAANPALPCPPINHTFAEGGPTFAGSIFPFVFICVMCGSISGFHALVSSGTTPKMIDKESQIRMIGYGSMLMEGVVGVVALIAAASLPMDLYYDINVDLDKAAKFQPALEQLYKDYGLDDKARQDRMHLAGADNLAHLDIDRANLAEIEELVGGESLRGRTGGAVTLAVGMARIFTKAMHSLNLHFDGIMKYWYHFAIMFEALFILTTIDTGTRIARFLMQETLGKVFPRFEKTDWLPGAILATAHRYPGLGLADRHRLDRHDLADVRHRQSALGGARVVSRDDHARQLRTRPLRARHAAADALRHDHDADGGRADGRAIHGGHQRWQPRARRPEPGADALRDDFGQLDFAVGGGPVVWRPDGNDQGKVTSRGPVATRIESGARRLAPAVKRDD